MPYYAGLDLGRPSVDYSNDGRWEPGWLEIDYDRIVVDDMNELVSVMGYDEIPFGLLEGDELEGYFLDRVMEYLGDEIRDAIWKDYYE